MTERGHVTTYGHDVPVKPAELILKIRLKRRICRNTSTKTRFYSAKSSLLTITTSKSPTKKPLADFLLREFELPEGVVNAGGVDASVGR